MGVLGILLHHPEEVPYLVRLKLAAMRTSRAIPADPHLAFCYKMLNKVSRSFAIVIQQLGPELRNAVCVFYLVLRALDTVEDDMSIPVDTKVPILEQFHKHIYDPSWHHSCGDSDYKVLMDGFLHISTAFLQLGKGYQDIIAEMTKRMGHGMAKFIVVEVEAISDYDEYCHYVAGIVGLGLSRLFHNAGLESLAPDALSNAMGLFLQKTNIIRDYLEDITELPAPRMFWPREIWSKYAPRLEDFKHEEHSEGAVECLNELITNSLQHACDSLAYLAALKDKAVFRFCAIPQIMAIGTLAVCYNNVGVFRGVVKIRRGLTAKIMETTQTMTDVYSAFDSFTSILAAKIDPNDPSAVLTSKCAENVREACRIGLQSRPRKSTPFESRTAHAVFLAMALIALFLAMLYVVLRS
eukprot:TRINITY_DN6360_c0_g3_i1.p1 TRINITY_DN6360_c0_g3~~TRINITY_DN6360_c0_g3_i1.p1  ORF type:complete len:410 (-),score=69.52 TRINITY_DN6360_c0_g3_i1:377-1606(-)